MSFKQISINLSSLDAERLSDIFFDLGALSVSVEDEYEGTELEQPIFNEPGMDVEKLWEHTKLVALFAENADIEEIVNSAALDFAKSFEYELEIVDDQDWVRLTQSQFEPIKVNDKLYIVPSWHSIPDESALGIVLDPGLAFGTGSHATTFMCLDWLVNHITTNDEVLDYGCGSGILAITAKKLEAKSVQGVDIDPQAMEASGYNAENNQVNVNFYLPDQFVAKQFDVVVANILSNPLRMLAAALSSYVKTNGKLVLSGILDSQIDEMSEIYQQWFDVKVYKIMDGWVSLECSKR